MTRVEPSKTGDTERTVTQASNDDIEMGSTEPGLARSGPPPRPSAARAQKEATLKYNRRLTFRARAFVVFFFVFLGSLQMTTQFWAQSVVKGALVETTNINEPILFSLSQQHFAHISSNYLTMSAYLRVSDGDHFRTLALRSAIRTQLAALVGLTPEATKKVEEIQNLSYLCEEPEDQAGHYRNGTLLFQEEYNEIYWNANADFSSLFDETHALVDASMSTVVRATTVVQAVSSIFFFLRCLTALLLIVVTSRVVMDSNRLVSVLVLCLIISTLLDIEGIATSTVTFYEVRSVWADFGAKLTDINVLGTQTIELARLWSYLVARFDEGDAVALSRVSDDVYTLASEALQRLEAFIRERNGDQPFEDMATTLTLVKEQIDQLRDPEQTPNVTMAELYYSNEVAPAFVNIFLEDMVYAHSAAYAKFDERLQAPTARSVDSLSRSVIYFFMGVATTVGLVVGLPSTIVVNVFDTICCRAKLRKPARSALKRKPGGSNENSRSKLQSSRKSETKQSRQLDASSPVRDSLDESSRMGTGVQHSLDSDSAMD